jgi:prophage DNA circulation protein
MMQPEDRVAFAISATAELVALVTPAALAQRERSRADDLAAALADSVPLAGNAPGLFLLAYAALARHLAAEGDPASLTPSLEAMVIDADIADAMTAAAASILAGALCVLMLRIYYAAQPDAAAARDSIKAVAETILEKLGDTLGFKAMNALDAATGETTLALSRIAASRAPLVIVETGVSLPSTLLAWELYEDPERAGELVERNRIGTPLLMPIGFEALAR